MRTRRPNSATPIFFLVLLAGALAVGSRFVFAADVEAENDLSCVGDRIAQEVNCNAGEFSAIVEIDHRSAQAAYNCVEGEYFYLNAEVALENSKPARYDIGFFAGQDGNDPKNSGGQCSVATFPGGPPPWFHNDNDTCGDYEARSSSDDFVQNLKVLCQDNGSGQLEVPYVLTYWQNDTQVCTGPSDVTTGSPSKCNTGTATVTNVSVSDPPCDTNYQQIFDDDFSDGDFDGWDPVRFEESNNQYVHNEDNLSIAWNGQTSSDEWDDDHWDVESGTLWWNRGGSAGSSDEYGMLTYPPDLIDRQLDGTTYSVSVAMNGYIEKNQNNGMGIIFGYQDPGNYYVARWTKVGTRYTADDEYPGYPKRLTLIRVQGGTAELLAETELPFDTNGAHTMKVTVNEHGITVCHDGVAKLNYGDARPVLRQFGLYSFDNDNGITFDDVDVRCEDCTAPDAASPIADWHFDEDTWDGTAREVEDHTGNGHDGTGADDADTIDPGKVCRGGTFDGNGDYVEVPNLSNLLNGTASLAFWIKTTQTGSDSDWSAPGVTGVEVEGGVDDIFWGWLDSTGHIGISVGDDHDAKSTIAVNDGTWRHVVLTRDASSGAYKVYVDGTLDTSGTTGSGIIGNSYSSIGRIEDTAGTHEYFQGELDEVLVFDGVLSDAEVQSGYANQAAGKNWDGSPRDCPTTEPTDCSAIFPSALQNSTGSGEIEFGWDAQVSDPDDALETANAIDYNSWGADTCGSTDCTATGTPSVAPTLEPFKTSDSTTDIDVDEDEEFTLGSGGISEYRDITGGEDSTITDGGGQDVYRIRTLTLDEDDKLVLRGGVDYWVENLEFEDDDIDIEVVGSGTARLFIGNDTEFTWNADVNEDGGPEDLLIVGYGDLTFGNGRRGELNALVYADGNISVSDFWFPPRNLHAHGAFAAAGNVYLGRYGQVDYDADAIENLDDRGFCGGEGETLDHIRLEHDGQGLTCRAETVTVTACANGDCSETYDDAVAVDFTSPASGWSPDPATVSGGQTDVELRQTTAGTVVLDAVATSPTAEDARTCVNTSGGPACEMVFTDVGVLIDGDDSDADPESPIITQIAGKPSNVAPPSPAPQQRVRVVRTDDQTGACIAGVGNETLGATFQYLVPIAGEGLGDNTVTITGNTSADLTSAGNGATVQLAFDGNGTAPFHFVSADAGRYSLRVDLGIPATDAEGAPTGETIAATDTSNAFVVRPFALFADGDGNPRAQDADGGVFRRAGEAFRLDFRSLQWSAGRDSDNDGLWDACGSSTLTEPGSGYARVPVWDIGQPDADLQLPAAGNNPGLVYGNGDAGFSAGVSDTSANDVSFGEVGIIQLQRGGLNPFLGEAVEVCSPYIGRFIPDRFGISDNAPQFADSCTSFTYQDQPFYFALAAAPEVTVTALNTAGNTTQNYGGEETGSDFWMLATDLGNRSYSDQTGSAATLAATLDVINPDILAGAGDYDGQGTLALDDGEQGDEFTYERQAKEAPFDADVDLTIPAGDLTDEDGVCYDSDDDGTCEDYTISGITGTELRFGRLAIYDAYGSELQDLDLPVQVEYWNGGTFQVNGADACTSLADNPPSGPPTWGDFHLSGYDGHLDDGDIDDLVWSGFTGGAGTVTLGAPGEGNDGEVDVTTLLDTAGIPWLQYDWDGVDQGGDGDFYDDNPTGHATFGIYQGNQHHIYLREQY